MINPNVQYLDRAIQGDWKGIADYCHLRREALRKEAISAKSFEDLRFIQGQEAEAFKLLMLVQELEKYLAQRNLAIKAA